MTIDVKVGRTRVAVSRRAFELLLDYSVVHSRTPYLQTLASGEIVLSDLQRLARDAHIPYSLFFAPVAVVEEQVRLNTAKLLQGVGKQTFSLNSRARVELRDIELIVKDLVRKQELLKKHDRSLGENSIAGMLRRSRKTPEQDGDALVRALHLRPEELRGLRSKERTLASLISCLEGNQILVSRNATGYMPQSLTRTKFSGLAVRDKKVPYVFLAGGDHGDHAEPVGRQLFTLTLMAVLVARGVFAPVTYNGHVLGTDPGREYSIVGHILMPADRLGAYKLVDLDAVRAAADHFKVTPSAVVVRAAHLKQIKWDAASGLLSELADEFARRPKKRGGPLKPVNGVRKYVGRELSIRMLDVLDTGAIGRSEFCRQVTLNKLTPQQIDEFRVAVR